MCDLMARYTNLCAHLFYNKRFKTNNSLLTLTSWSSCEERVELLTHTCSLYTGSVPVEIKLNILRVYSPSATLLDHLKG